LPAALAVINPVIPLSTWESVISVEKVMDGFEREVNDNNEL
jgi:hypothetical protein